MLPLAATVAWLRLLQAKAKVESAKVKIKPPWQSAWPLSCSARTVMRLVVPLAAVSVFVMLPLDYLWWRLIGYFG